MLANVFTKTIGDRWLGWAIAVGSLAALFPLGMWGYQGIDPTFFQALPKAYLSLLRIPKDADIASIAINAIVNSYGALALAAMALAMGAASIAGEERGGTLGLLLANPRSRTYVLVSKAASMTVLTALAVVGIWGAMRLSALALDVSIKGMDVEALSVHLLVNSLFYGFLAMAVSAWSGNRGAAIGVATGVMLISFFAVGVLPLVEGAGDYVQAFPWHYYNGSEPLINGVDWGHIGVLTAACAVLAAAALLGLNRRDLKGQSVGVTLVDRLRANPLTNKVVGRLAGSARVSSIWVKTASEYQVHLTITALAMFLVMGVMLGPMYAAIPKETFAAFEQFPKEMITLFGGGDISTPEGWYQIETFGMMAPIAVMVVAIAIGAGALAGEEQRRTMGLLLANPIRRSRVIIEKAWTMVLYAFLIGLVTFAGVALGSVLGNLGMDTGNIAATCLLQTLVGLVFGALALALSAGTGRKKVAIFGAVGAGLSLHVLNGFAQLNDTMAALAKWSPFNYYLGSDPLNTGMDWGNAAVLAGLAVSLIALSVLLFQRRDIRQTG